jgi:hypothetical protein
MNIIKKSQCKITYDETIYRKIYKANAVILILKISSNGKFYSYKNEHGISILVLMQKPE